MHKSHAWMRRTIGLFLDKLFSLAWCFCEVATRNFWWGGISQAFCGANATKKIQFEDTITSEEGYNIFLWSFRKFSPFLSTEWVSVYVLVVCIPIYSCQVLFTALTNQISLAQNEIHLVNGRLNEWKPFWIPGNVRFPVLQVQCFT